MAILTRDNLLNTLKLVGTGKPKTDQSRHKTLSMDHIIKIKRNGSLFLFLCLVLMNCSPTIAFYDQYAFTQATSLKVDLQNLVQESGTVSFPEAKADIDKVNVALQKAYEYSKGRSKNTLSTDQYLILLSDNHLYKTFLKTWSSQGKLSLVGASEISDKIGQLMDQIIQLESGKRKQDH
jgi:hypothetical protein